LKFESRTERQCQKVNKKSRIVDFIPVDYIIYNILWSIKLSNHLYLFFKIFGREN